jgi:hypothetical protein
LEANGYSANRENLASILSASTAIYSFLSTDGEGEINDYRSQIKGRRPIKGPLVLQFDLVIQILSSIVNYCSEHPGEAIQTAAALAYLEERLDKKIGEAGKRIWRKMWARKATAPPRRQVARLAKIAKKLARTKTTRASSSAIQRKRKPYKQMKLD